MEKVVCFLPEASEEHAGANSRETAILKRRVCGFYGLSLYTLTGVYFRDKNAPEHDQLTDHSLSRLV